jgi:transposase InsO family protein
MMRECPYKDIISSAIANHKRDVAPGLLAVTKAPKFVTIAAGAGLEVGDNNSFVVDTGSAYHNVFDRSILHHFKPVTEGQERGIQMPNGMVEPILGTGSVYLEVKTPCGGDDTIILREVQWAPCLKFNLLSENTAKYKGARFEDSKGGGKLLYKPGEAIPSVLCELHKNVHVMKCRPIPVEPAELAQQSMVLLSGATASEVKQYEAERLHRALGHPGNSALGKTLEGHVEGTSVTPEAVKQLGACEQCLAGKQTRNPFPDSGRAADWKLGELIVFDLFVAPTNVVSQHGFKYQLTAVDFYSRYCLVSFLTHKHEAVNSIKKIHAYVERQTGGRTKSFRTDRGGEFLNNDVVDYCNELGIQLELTTPYTSQQNGLAERMHLTIFNKVRAMLVDSGIDKQHWAEAAGTAAYVYNRTASSATPGGKTPFECYWGKKPDISNLRPFGDVAMVMTMPRYARDGKMGPISVKGRLMGYSKCYKAWRVLLPTGLVSESRDVVFPADKFTARNLLAQHGNSPATLPAASSSPPPPQHEQDSDSSGSDEDSSKEYDFSEDEGDTPHQGQPTAEGVAQGATTTIRTSSRVRRPLVRLTLLEGATTEESVTLRAADDALKVDWFRGERAGQHPIPQTMEQMRKHPYHKGYEDAIIVEMESIKARGVLEPVRWERGLKVIDTKVVFDEKVDEKGLITSLKARLVAKGFRQSKGKDYTEVWAPVSKHSSLRAVLAVAAAKDWILHQVDVKTAFLHANLDEELYVRVPADLPGGGGTFRLRKAIYGLKQASRAWYKHLKGIMEGMGFHQSTADPGVYLKDAGTDQMVVVVTWVDDIVIASKLPNLVVEVESGLEQHMEIKRQGDLKHHLGMEIQRQGNKILLTQKTYTQDVLYRFGMESCKGQKVLLNSKVKVTREAGEKLDKDGLKLYQEKVGSLQNLATCSRPYISFAVGLLGRFCKCPTTFHMELADQVLSYIAWTRDMGLEFGGRKPNFIVYSDSDFGGETDERRSTTGFVCILSGGAVDWNSRLQQTVAVSTCEAEYQAAGAAVRAVVEEVATRSGD